MTDREHMSRRGVIAGLGVAAAGAALGAQAAENSEGAEHAAWHQSVDAWMAKQEIAELRRQYALATDLIGMATDEAIAQGRAIYRRIFTADAKIGATGQPQVTGPDAWVTIAHEALKIYENTQHLIGTQVIDLQGLPNAAGEGGQAVMSSYLQAWHAKADGEMWLFIGTYYDKLSYTKGVGWQIHDMVLNQVSGDRRKITGS